jgi:mono/diheme cytochrome c family protein
LIGGVILGGGALLIIGMTTAAYVSEYRNPPVVSKTSAAAPVLYIKWCSNCHGRNGEGGQQGRLRFPPLTGVGAKPQRTVEDIVGLLKDPPAYGLQPPMRSFSEKITEPQMREIAEWVHRLR